VLIDDLMLGIVSFLISRLVRSTVVVNVIYWVPVAVYFTWCEGQPSGQTLGKRVLGIRVVDDATGGSIGYARALLRFVVSGISFIALLFGYLSMLGDSAGQTWHDKAARSLVVPA
jgi:uncharacterized RDD family membrane protein YckC